MDPRQAPWPPWRMGMRAFAEVDRATGQQYPCARRQGDHPAAVRSARTTMVSSVGSVSSETRNTALPIPTSMLAANGACPLCSDGSATIGAKLGAAALRSSRRQVNPIVHERVNCALPRPRLHQA